MASTQSIDPEKAREFAIHTVKTLRDASFLSYWAGGCVRDYHLQKLPQDYDVATSATPDEIRKLFGKNRTLAIGASFGVITLIGSKQQGNIEIATFREDVGYSDGRHPDQVTFSTPEADALRRDFTINGMFLDPITMETIDYVGGLDDLQGGLIRAIGDPADRFEEDKLRILRAIRFATTLNFELDPTTRDAVCRSVEKLNQVSRERILVELEKTLTSEFRARGLMLLSETGILPCILPDTQADQSSIELVRQVLQLLPLDDFSLTLAALFKLLARELSARDVHRILKSMTASNETANDTRWILETVDYLIQADSEPWPAIQRILVHPQNTAALNLASALVKVLTLSDDGICFCQQKLDLPESELNPAEFLTGADLIKLGMTPGPAFSKVLRTIRDQQLLKSITTKDQAVALARSTYQSINTEQ